MKKSVIGLAALTTCSWALAQTNMEWFGVADLGLQHASQNGRSVTQLTSSGNAPSSIGFRATRELSDGMHASVWAEASLGLDTGSTLGGSGTVSGTSSNTRTVQTLNRRSTVEIGGAWGAVRLGRDVLPRYWNLTVFDPFRTLGSGSNNSINGRGLYAFSGGTSRSDNAISYLYGYKPNADGHGMSSSGLVAHLMYAPGEQTTNVADTGRYTGARVAFHGSDFRLAAAYGTTVQTATNKFKNYNLSGSYNIKNVANLMATFGVNDQDAANQQNKFFQLGANIPVGKGYIPISYVSSKLNTTTGGKGSLMAVGYVHNFDPKTVIYTTVARLSNSGGANFGFAGGNLGFAAPSGMAAADQKGNALDIGVRYSF